ncbi:MAG: nucleotide exchange factor GrpE [Planctomycetota bacterium]|nr:MAG: nucleotide exchange factor GrpE [Planctomycetota bacterium]
MVQRRASAGGSQRVPPAGASVKADLDRINNSVNRLANSFRVVESSVVKVAEAYQRIARANQRKEQAYDQLYEELRAYKDNFLLAAQKPLFKDIILLFDGVRRSLANFEQHEGDSLPKEQVVTCLKHLQEEVLEVLYRRDIELIDEHPERLNIDFQKPVQRIETDNPDEDRQVVQVVREGFRMNGVLLRAQEVIVKRCVKEEQETE